MGEATPHASIVIIHAVQSAEWTGQEDTIEYVSTYYRR